MTSVSADTEHDGAAREDAERLASSVREPERFGEIFDRYFAEIHGYVARRLGRDIADDVAAETFLTAFRSRRRFDADRGTVRSWLYGIATNHLSAYHRQEIRACKCRGGGERGHSGAGSRHGGLPGRPGRGARRRGGSAPRTGRRAGRPAAR